MDDAARVPFGERVRDLCGELHGAADAEAHARTSPGAATARGELVGQIAAAVLSTTSKSAAMLGWLSVAAARASSTNRARRARRPTTSCGGRLHQRDRAADLGVACAEDVAERAAAEALEDVVVRDLLVTGDYFLRGRDGRSSTRLGRLRAGCASRSMTTSATSSGASFQSRRRRRGRRSRWRPILASRS